MYQSLQQNAAMMAQLHSHPYPLTSQKTSPLYQYKPQSPPFPKWYITPTTTPLLFSQIATYKSEAYYSGVHNWTCTTLARRQLSVAISSDNLASLLSMIPLMFLNGAIFVSDRIAMISLLITHLNPSSSKNPLLAISDLNSIKMQHGKSRIDYM